MTLRCNLLGHRRSASRATFDEKNERWLSECKRCHILLVRGPDGNWTPLPPQPDRLEPLPREEAPMPAAEEEDPVPVAPPQIQKAVAAA